VQQGPDEEETHREAPHTPVRKDQIKAVAERREEIQDGGDDVEA
jgi:hypothetical protein